MIDQIKTEITEMGRLGAFSKPLDRVLAYADANADELVGMVENEGASISDAADLAVECA